MVDETPLFIRDDIVRGEELQKRRAQGVHTGAEDVEYRDILRRAAQYTKGRPSSDELFLPAVRLILEEAARDPRPEFRRIARTGLGLPDEETLH